MEILKAPNSKSQIPRKFQDPISKRGSPPAAFPIAASVLELFWELPFLRSSSLRAAAEGGGLGIWGFLTEIGSPWALTVMVLAMICNSASAQASREYQIKSAFLFNFAEFTEWPPEAFETKDSPLIIGILGTDPFGGVLDETVRNETVRGHRLVVERYRKVEEIQTCHILYIGQSEASRLDHVLGAIKGKPILTVSDIEGAALRGAAIRFLNEKNKIRLRVNLEAARTAGVTISSKLLRAAEIVTTDKK
jgi:hypothetical protein